MRFHLTPHYARRLEDRSLSDEKCRSIVTYGRKRLLRNGTRGGKVFEFTEKTESESNRLIVVAEVLKKDCYLMTAYIEGK